MTLDPTMLLYTYISRFSVTPHYIKSGRVAATNAVPQPFLIAVSTSLTNGPRLLSQAKVGTHSAFRERSHTAAHTAKQGPSGRGRYYYPRSVPHVSETLRGQGVERQTLPLLGLGRGCSRRTQKAFGTAMRLCVSLSRRRRGPAGLRDPVAIVSMIKNMINPWAGSFLIFCWANANSIKKVVLQPF